MTGCTNTIKTRGSNDSRHASDRREYKKKRYDSFRDREDDALAITADLHDRVGAHGDEGGISGSEVAAAIAVAVGDMGVYSADDAAVGAGDKAKADRLEDVVGEAELGVESGQRDAERREVTVFPVGR